MGKNHKIIATYDPRNDAVTLHHFDSREVVVDRDAVENINRIEGILTDWIYHWITLNEKDEGE